MDHEKNSYDNIHRHYFKVITNGKVNIFGVALATPACLVNMLSTEEGS